MLISRKLIIELIKLKLINVTGFAALYVDENYENLSDSERTIKIRNWQSNLNQKRREEKLNENDKYINFIYHYLINAANGVDLGLQEIAAGKAILEDKFKKIINQ